MTSSGPATAPSSHGIGDPSPRPGDDGAVRRFPEGFVWGVATSAYQIEGGATADGRSPSIWDTFAAAGRTRDGADGSRAAEHRWRMTQDVALLAELGIPAYRFSVAWPRVQPGGQGAASQAGLDFYRALVDELLDHDIEPVATLYHWDLPQALEDEGGWPVRATAERFAEYAELVGAALGDRVRRWTTINEPWCAAMLGYAGGIHAPGHTDPGAAVAAGHHLLLAHGLAVDVLRAHVTSGRGTPVPGSADREMVAGPGSEASPVAGADTRPGSGPGSGPATGSGPGSSPAAGTDTAPGAGSGGVEIGITLNPYPVVATGDRPEDRDAARRIDGLANRLWYDPVLRGRYPDDVLEDVSSVSDLSHIRDGDLAQIARPIDALGLNYYRRYHVRHQAGASTISEWPGSPDVAFAAPDRTPTTNGWAVEPRGLHEALIRVATDYDPPPLYVHENGGAFPDRFGPDGQVHDDDRIAFLDGHLRAAHDAITAGADLRGFFVWSYLDNFEWAEGYSDRFGIVHVDFATQRRTPKASARWFGRVATANALPPGEGRGPAPDGPPGP